MAKTSKEIKNVVEAKEAFEHQLKEKIKALKGKIYINNVDMTNTNWKEFPLETPDMGVMRIHPTYVTVDIANDIKWSKLEDGSIVAILVDGHKRSVFWFKDEQILASNLSAKTFGAVYAILKDVDWKTGNTIYKKIIGRTDGVPKNNKNLPVLSPEEVFGKKRN